jgi:molybdopterin converting factor small subunit
MVLTCQYCGKQLCNEASLKRHHKTKSCQSKRTDIIEIMTNNTYKCQYCSKSFNTKKRLEEHNLKCVKKVINFIDEKDKIIKEKDEIIKSQKLEIEELKLKLKTQRLEIENELLRKDREIINNMAQQPRTTNNNNLIIPSIDTSQEKINMAVENNYDMNHFCSGQKGIARFAVDHILRDDKKQLGYICTDPARSVFKYMGEDGEIVRDMKATRLTTKLAVPIKEKAGKLATELIDKDRELISAATESLLDIRLINDNNTVFRTELASVTSN